MGDLIFFKGFIFYYEKQTYKAGQCEQLVVESFSGLEVVICAIGVPRFVWSQTDTTAGHSMREVNSAILSG